jgi:hypothetical protein
MNAEGKIVIDLLLLLTLFWSGYLGSGSVRDWADEDRYVFLLLVAFQLSRLGLDLVVAARNSF